MRYKVKVRHIYSPFWKTLVVCGHNYSKDGDRMDFHLVDNGGIYSIPLWSKHIIKLGQDFILSQKEDMEKTVGQSIPLNKG